MEGFEFWREDAGEDCEDAGDGYEVGEGYVSVVEGGPAGEGGVVVGVGEGLC